MEAIEHGAVLSDKTIKECVKTGEIIISPFREDFVTSCAYDVTLGSYFWRGDSVDRTSIFNPSSSYSINSKFRLLKAMTLKSIKQVFSENPKKPQLPISLFEQNLQNKAGTTSDVFVWDMCNTDPQDAMYGIDDDEEIIFLRPGETILAHTQEFIGGVKNVTTKMQARSSIGRSNLEVCRCAGWGDVGYFNRWTMEIQSNNDRIIPLVVGRRIAQISFFRTDPTDMVYSQTGNYQQTEKLEELINNWNPHMILPKPWKKDPQPKTEL